MGRGVMKTLVIAILAMRRSRNKTSRKLLGAAILKCIKEGVAE